MIQNVTGPYDLSTVFKSQHTRTNTDSSLPQTEIEIISDNHSGLIPQPLSRDQFIVIIPELVDVERIKSLCEYANLDYKKALLFIHLVCQKTAYIKSYKPFKSGESYTIKEDKLTSKRAADLPDDELQTYLSNDASKYFSLLNGLGILYRAPYEVGQCFSYGLKRGHYASRFKLVLLEDYSIMNKMRGKHYADAAKKVKKSKSKNVVKSTPEIEQTLKTSNIEALEEHFCHLFNKTKFSVDYKAAEKSLFQKYHSDTIFPLSNYEGYAYNLEFKSYTAYHAAVVQLANFLNGKYYFSRKVEVSPKGKMKSKDRFYTSISQMNKIVRGMLHYEGEKLVQLDVKNCTPYLLSNYLPSLFSADETTFIRLFNSYGFFFKYFRYHWNKTVIEVPIKPYGGWFKGKFKHKAGKFGCHISSVELKSFYFTYVFVKKSHSDITTLNCESAQIGKGKTKSYCRQNYPLTLSKYDQKSISVIVAHNSLGSTDSWTNCECGFELTENKIKFTSNESSNDLLFDNPKFNYEISFTPRVDDLHVISDGSFPGLCFNNFIKAQYQNDFNSTEINVEHTSRIGFNKDYYIQDFKAQYLFGNNQTENYVELTRKKCYDQKGLYFNFSSSLEQALYYISQETLGSTINREFNDFLTECINGKIYDNLVSHVKILYMKRVWSRMFHAEFKSKYEENHENDRAMTKKLFISMMYADNSKYKGIQMAFSKVYPVIYDIIYQRKQSNPKELLLWGFLKDSELIVDKIARPLITKHKIVAFTIHDCVMVKERYVKKLRTKMNEVFLKEFGNAPKIEQE